MHYHLCCILCLLTTRTPPISRDEKRDTPCAALGRHLPELGQELIFGSSSQPASKINAAEVAAGRRLPFISVYVVSTNLEHESSIPFLFQDIPHRMVKLTAQDFFTKEQGVYEGMGVDRLATLRAAAHLYRPPVLVIDGGTALTYTGLDARGHIMGGGISPGLKLRFETLHVDTGALPLIEFDDYEQIIKQTVDYKQPLSLFSKDTKRQIMTDTFHELAGKLRHVVRAFLAVVQKQQEEDREKNPKKKPAEVEKDIEESKDEAATQTNTQPPPTIPEDENETIIPSVCVTGGDAFLIETLLKPNHSYLVPMEPGTSLPADEFELQKEKKLIHYGIMTVLRQHCKQAMDQASPVDLLRIEIIGQRVAKRFPRPDEDDDYIFRGTVMSVTPGNTFEEDWFTIRYDDGDQEDLDIVELYGT